MQQGQQTCYKVSAMQTNKRILIVEDDPDDRELLADAVKKADPVAEVQLAENGLQAMDYLNALSSRQAPLPGLIVLDLNMPYLDGKATFEKIKSNHQFDGVPVIIFTSSLNPNDKLLFNHRSAEFISKPYHFSVMKDIAHHLLAVCNQH